MNENRSRQHYKAFFPMTTRWMDNDIYGHVNNVQYYSYFDTAANQFLIEHGGLDIQNAKEVGFVVASSCQYFAPIAHPQQLEIGFRVNHLGNSSVEYGLAVFVAGADQASAVGSFTHVFVNRGVGSSVAIPTNIRTALETAL